MTIVIIISLCTIILLSYVFDLTSKKTKIPSVILLLVIGLGMRQLEIYLQLHVPDLKSVLPVIGTIGLILIVLEGSLDLKLTRSTLPIIKRTFLLSFFSFVIVVSAFTAAIVNILNIDFSLAIINAIPLSIISSAIAISGAYHLHPEKKEFIVYESTFSDIIGIVFFNFFVLNGLITVGTLFGFLFDIGLIIILSVISGLVLSALLQRITHHVKFVPIIAILLLMYSIGKLLHLPSLILVLLFGLLLNNIQLLDYKPVHQFIFPETVSRELIPFKNIVAELTFVLRSFFFIMFGFFTDVVKLFNLENALISLGIVLFIILSRFVILKIARIPMSPVLYIAPRGLITILLFLSIPDGYRITEVNEGVLSQVIFLSAFVMVFGLINQSKIRSGIDKKQNE